MDPVSSHPEVAHEQPTLWSVGLKGGLITGGVLFLLTFIFQYMLEMYGNMFLMLGMGILAVIIGIVLTHKGFKRDGDGYMSYGQGLGLAVISMTVAGLLAGLLSFLYISFVDPGVPEKIADASIEMAYSMTERMGGEVDDATEDMLEAQRQEAIDKGANFVGTVLGAGFMYLIMGLIFGLIISAFTKNNHPEQVY
ncbi:MAG: DUF4199 domain-containing protein [Bacteroidetes bacterium]|nr:DUF4199 domain-containing protein [Bacteroidota bacterium]